MGSWAWLDDFDGVQDYAVKAGVNMGQISRAYGHSGGQVAAPAAYSIAYNTIAGSGSSASSPTVILQGPGGLLTVPNWAEMIPSLPGYPAGFEVAIDGQVGAREVFLRTVMMALNAGTTKAGTFQGLDQTTEISFAPSYDW
jgi:hypothetical protein